MQRELIHSQYNYTIHNTLATRNIIVNIVNIEFTFLNLIKFLIIISNNEPLDNRSQTHFDAGKTKAAYCSALWGCRCAVLLLLYKRLKSGTPLSRLSTASLRAHRVYFFVTYSSAMHDAHVA